MPTLFEQWKKTKPAFETRYEDAVINKFATYGQGANQYTDARGRFFGAAYEVYILAFFIGLYANRCMTLSDNNGKVKNLGVPVGDWKGKTVLSNDAFSQNRKTEPQEIRKPYPELLEYIFAALVARTDIDLMALEEGKISLSTVANQLRKKMEEYANFGFHLLRDKLENEPEKFYSDHGFLHLFRTFAADNEMPEENEDEPSLI